VHALLHVQPAQRCEPDHALTEGCARRRGAVACAWGVAQAAQQRAGPGPLRYKAFGGGIWCLPASGAAPCNTLCPCCCAASDAMLPITCWAISSQSTKLVLSSLHTRGCECLRRHCDARRTPHCQHEQRAAGPLLAPDEVLQWSCAPSQIAVAAVSVKVIMRQHDLVVTLCAWRRHTGTLLPVSFLACARFLPLPEPMQDDLPLVAVGEGICSPWQSMDASLLIGADVI